MKCIKQFSLFLLFQFYTGFGMAQEFTKNYAKGTAAYQKGKYQEAVFQFQKCLNNHTSDSALVYNALGDTYSYWEDYTMAILNYKMALDLHYQAAIETYFKLSTAYYNTKDFIKSMYFCNLILEKNQGCTDAKVYWRMNILYSLRNEPENASSILKKGAKNGVKELQYYCEQRSIAWNE